MYYEIFYNKLIKTIAVNIQKYEPNLSITFISSIQIPYIIDIIIYTNIRKIDISSASNYSPRPIRDKNNPIARMPNLNFLAFLILQSSTYITP